MTDDDAIGSLVRRHEIPTRTVGLPVDHRLADLCVALMESAIVDLRGGDTSSHGSLVVRRREAQRWVSGESGCHPLVTFETCCAVIGLDEEAARKRLMGVEARWRCGGETEASR